MHKSSKHLSMHYSGFMVLTLSMIVVFFLGLLIVEVPFGTGLGYFHTVQRQSVFTKKLRMMQMQNAKQVSEVTVAGFSAEAADACATDYDDCTEVYANELRAGFMTEDEWSISQAECEAMRDECVADVSVQ